MESWVPLFNIFLNSPTPESEASRWFHDSFNASSSPTTITTNSFLSLLTRPATGVRMWMETLPTLVQSRILSFLAYERKRFSTHDLVHLATSLLRTPNDQDADFWVEKGARNLLGILSHSSDLKSRSNLINEEFYSLPDWLKGAEEDDGSGLVLPWLPVPVDELRLVDEDTPLCGCHELLFTQISQDGEGSDAVMDENPKGHINNSTSKSNSFDPELQTAATNLNSRLLKLELSSETAQLAKEIRHLCLDRTKGDDDDDDDSLAVLELIQPWRVDDEILAVLLPHLLAHLDDQHDNNTDSEEQEDGWPSQVLCSTILPKLLSLEQQASRVLTNLTIDFCKIYHRAAEYALLLPLILRKEPINTHIADVMIRIVKECLHPAHIGAFCQKLLCTAAADNGRRRFMCLPCHRSLISADEPVWCEPMFSLFQNILNQNVHLTQDSVDCLVTKVDELAGSFSRSLKFGNFLLCFVIKCFNQLNHHKLLLTESASRTNTLVTKAILVKLSLL